MADEKYSDPINEVLKSTFEQSARDQIIKNYLSYMGDQKKWLCFSDYYLDEDKPNKVVSFTLLPHIINFEELSAEIKRLQSKDIKNAKNVNPEFIDFMRRFPIINFSFILGNHKFLMTQNFDGLKIILTNTFTRLLEDAENWKKNNSALLEHYNKLIKAYKNILNLIKQNRKIYLIKDMLLIGSLGSFVCGFIANQTKAELMGWFSDRDATNDFDDYASANLFHVFFHNRVSHKCEFAYSPAQSSSDEFYKDFTRIPDYITGTLADFNLIDAVISKDKFDQMLLGFFAGNELNNFVFNLDFKPDGSVFCTRLTFHPKTE